MTGQPPREQPRPCNYRAAEHDGEVRRYAPGWRCQRHTPRAVHQRHNA